MTLAVELDAYDTGTSSAVTKYLADRDLQTGPSDTPANTSFLNRVTGFDVTRALVSQRGLSGSSEGDAGTITLDNADGGLDGWKDLALDGRRLLVKYAATKGTAYSAYTTIFRGTAKEVLVGESQVVVRLRGQQFRLDRPAQRDRYLGHQYGLWFDGANDRLDLPVAASPIAGTTWTVEGWFRAPRGVQTSAQGRVLFIDYTGGDLFIDVASESGSAAGRIRVTSNVTNRYTGHVVADGRLHHVAITRASGGTGKIYLDGVLVRNAPTLGTEITSGGTTTNLRLGAGGTGATPTNGFLGELSDWRFWTTERSDAEIAAYHRALLAGDESGLLAWYRLNEGVDIQAGLTSDPDGTKEVYDPASRTDAIVLDHALSPAGKGFADIVGAPEWRRLGQAIGREGQPKPLPVGSAFNTEPELVVQEGQVRQVAGSPIRKVKAVREGGRQLLGSGYLQLDGVDDYVDVPNIAAYNLATSGAITLEVIFEADAQPATSQMLVEQLAGLDPSCFIRLGNATNGSVSIALTDSLSTGASGALFAHLLIRGGERHQISAVFDPGNLVVVLYVDGELAGSKAISAITGNYNWAGSWRFGNRQGLGPSEYFDGQIHQVRFWNAGRTQDAIRQDLFAEMEGSETGLVGYWAHDDGSGTTVTDSTSNANHGTTSGSPTWREADYTVVNDHQGCAVELKSPPTSSLRCDVDGWLPLGHAITSPVACNSSSRYQAATASALPTGDFSVHLWTDVDGDVATTHDPAYLAWHYVNISTVGGWQLQLDTTTNAIKVAVVTSTGVQTFTATTLLDAQEWRSVGFTWDDSASTVRLYINGELVETSVKTGSVSTASVTTEFRFAYRLEGASMNQVSYWSKQLSDAEMARLAYRRRPPLEHANLLLYYPCDEGPDDTLTTAYDLSLSRNNATRIITDQGRGPGVYPETAAQIARFMAAQGDHPSATAIELDAPLAGDEIDVTSLGQYDTDTSSAAVGWLVTTETVSELLDRLFAPVGWWGFSRAGELVAGQALAPDVSGASSAATHTKSKQVSIERRASTLPATEVSLAWRRNWLPYERAELVAAVLERPAKYRQLIDPAQLARQPIAGVSTPHLLASADPLIETALQTRSGAIALLADLRGNRGTKRTVYVVDLMGDLGGNLGSAVTLSEDTDPKRFNWASDQFLGLVVIERQRLQTGDLFTQIEAAG